MSGMTPGELNRQPEQLMGHDGVGLEEDYILPGAEVIPNPPPWFRVMFLAFVLRTYLS